MYDPAKPAGNKTTVATIDRRADHGNSEDGVLGMTLAARLRPRRSDQAQRLRLLLAAQRRLGRSPATLRCRVQPDQPLHAHRGRHRGRARLRARDPARPKAKISGNPAGFPGGPANNGPGHVGGAGLDFDSAGNLYLGVGDDVSPERGGPQQLPADGLPRPERWDARKTSQNSADLRGKVVRITPLQDIPAGREPGVGTTYTVPAGNLFPVGTAKTRPEIYAMGFRQPFTLHTDPKNPGIVGVGEYCHDNTANRPTAPRRHLRVEPDQPGPGNFGWPFCVGDNSTGNTMFRWNYQANATTGQQYDCSLTNLPSDIRSAPDGPDRPRADLRRPRHAARPGRSPRRSGRSTTRPTARRFGDLDAGGMQPVAGPIYRYDEGTAGQGAFPRYYDGSWHQQPRRARAASGRKSACARTTTRCCASATGCPTTRRQLGRRTPTLVIGSQFGPDGALYMARYSVGCCRYEHRATPADPDRQDLVQRPGRVPDRHERAERVAHDRQAYLDQAEHLTSTRPALRLTGDDSGCAGVKNIEYRQRRADWVAYTTDVTFDDRASTTIEYRATDRKDNVATAKTATFTVLQINDTTPEVERHGGGQGPARLLHRLATLAVTATDNEIGLRRRIDRVPRQRRCLDHLHGSGRVQHPGRLPRRPYRATGQGQQTRGPKPSTFRILSGRGLHAGALGRVPTAPLGAQWLRHTRNGGTPTSARSDAADGKLTMPTANFELERERRRPSGRSTSSARTSRRWATTGRSRPQFTGQVQRWLAERRPDRLERDNNFFRSTITHDLNAGNIYVEQSKDNPTSTEGARVQAGGQRHVCRTCRRRSRSRCASRAPRLQHRRRPVPRRRAGHHGLRRLGQLRRAATPTNLNPTSGARRDAAGSRIGIMTRATSRAPPARTPTAGTPGTVKVDYFRVTPDPIDCEAVAPTTTATLDPPAPATGDTYDRAVKVNLSATDAGTCAGVEKTEYRVTTNGVAGNWTTKDNTADAPTTTS